MKFAFEWQFSAARRRVSLALVAAALVVACGGGTQAIQAFVPGRIIAFGDETNLITSSGKSYSIGGLDTNSVLDCGAQPIWLQILSIGYGFVLEQCKGTLTEFKAISRATVGAQADDVSAQLEVQIAAGGFKTDDLATVLVGANDVLDLYARFPAQSEAALTAELEARGKRVGQQVNRLVGLGPRVIVVTIPDVSLSPYARAQKVANTDTDRMALLSRLVYAYNASVRLNIINDGRFVGLVLGDEQVQAMNVSPPSFSLTDVATAACTVALPDCTTATLITGATALNHLWADDRRPGPNWHSRIANLAASRARLNPF